MSTARRDSQLRPPPTASSRSTLLQDLLERVLCFFDVLERQASRFNEPRDDGRRPAAEQVEELVDQSRVSLVPGDARLEDIGVADPLDAAQRLLLLQPIDDGLDSRKRRSTFRGQPLVELTD